MKDNLIALLGVLFLLLVVVVWPVFYFTAPCDKLDWLPVQNTPGRCLKIEIRQ